MPAPDTCSIRRRARAARSQIAFTPDDGEIIDMIVTTQFFTLNLPFNQALYGMRLKRTYHRKAQTENTSTKVSH